MESINAPEAATTTHAVRAAERIRALNSINDEIPSLLTSASTALSSLTSKPLPPTSTTNATNLPSSPLEARKATFQAATSAYFKTIVSLSERLKAEVDELEKAGIIPNEVPRRGAAGYEDGVVNGGLGGFDIGILNARVGDPGKGWEAEVVARAREILERKVEGRKQTKSEDGIEKMEE